MENLVDERGCRKHLISTLITPKKARDNHRLINLCKSRDVCVICVLIKALTFFYFARIEISFKLFGPSPCSWANRIV
jgi:hypothetical protein